MKRITNKNIWMKEIENKEGMSIEELLRRKYVDENKSTQTISDELGISYATTCKWLLSAGIYSRKLRV